jgi:hypothetical protein
MRTDANQGELALDAPLDVVLGCRSEADAVRKCLRLALRLHGRDQKTVAQICGWKSDSCLSEIANETNKRSLPTTKLHRFSVATGCNLVSQYRGRMKAEARRAGKTSQRDEAEIAAESCLAAWRNAA